MQAPVYGGQPAAPGGFEFSPQDNLIIGTLGGRARSWGMLSIVLGILMFLAGVGSIVTALVVLEVKRGGMEVVAVGATVLLMSLPPLITGKFYVDAGQAMKRVVDTQGNDIPHVLEGVGKLTSAVRLEALVSIVGVVLGIAFLVVVSILAAGLR